MSLDTTEKTLEKEFEKFGRLRKVKVVRNLGTGTSRGFAFVYFDDPEDARTARNEMNGRKEIDGHKEEYELLTKIKIGKYFLLNPYQLLCM